MFCNLQPFSHNANARTSKTTQFCGFLFGMVLASVCITRTQGDPMKGVIFTELLGFVEHKAGVEFAEDVLDAAALPNHGAFTKIGTYPAAHALRLVEIASEKSGIPASDLSVEYGEWLFNRFTI
jgi:hypothetical protein